MMGFIDQMRAEGFAVESICRVLREQGCQVAARTYRAWKTGRVAARTITDARVVDVVRELIWAPDPRSGRLLMTPEGLYGRRKMTALVRRQQLPDASAGSAGRAMRVLGLSGVRRDTHVRTTIPAKDGIRAGGLSQYTSIRLTESLALEGIQPSIGSVGDAYDNALMERPSTASTRPSASAPPSSSRAPTRRWPTWSTPPPTGSIGTTSDAFTDPWHDQPRGVRNRPLRGPHPRAATRMRAAENLGRFTSWNAALASR
jgi:hypothetical protein